MVAFVYILTATTTSFAVRGIDAPHVERPPKPCSKLLLPGKQVTVTFGGETEVAGRLAYVDSGGMGLRQHDESGDPDAVSYLTKDRIVSMRVQKSRFPRPLSSLGGFGLGVLAGTIVAVAAGYGRDHDDGGGDGSFPPDFGGVIIVTLGATAGLVLGTVLPIVHPGETEIECAW